MVKILIWQKGQFHTAHGHIQTLPSGFHRTLQPVSLAVNVGRRYSEKIFSKGQNSQTTGPVHPIIESAVKKLTKIENSLRFYGYSLPRIGIALLLVTGKNHAYAFHSHFVLC